MVEVRTDAMLREFMPKRTVTMEAPDVRSLIEGLESMYPALRLRLRDETGAMRRFVRVFVNGEEISALNGLSTNLAPQDTVHILHSIQGG
ncbi:MAG: MoaD/ThiS family protein [Thermoplasmata archaeon]